MMRALRFSLITVWFLLGLYGGLAGYLAANALGESTSAQCAGREGRLFEFQGLTFASQRDLKDFLQEQESANWFPWIFELPQILIVMLACAGFGVAGGAARMIRQLAKGQNTVTLEDASVVPLLGGITGLLMYFLAFLVHSAFVSGECSIRLVAVVGLSLFGGYFYEDAHAWVSKQVKRIFS